MDKTSNLALIAQMIDAAEKNIISAKQLLRQMLGAERVKQPGQDLLGSKLSGLNISAGGKIIEGVFDGHNMVGPDSKQYPVPANYASKSKLVVGDVLKLTIAEDGSFIYKQIEPVERKKILGLLTADERGDFRVVADGRTYKVLLASLTYFKAEAGDEVTIVVPAENSDVEWAAVENVIKKGEHSADVEMDTGGQSGKKVLRDDDDEL